MSDVNYYAQCSCGSIWFWSPFTAGALRCARCEQPAQPPRRGPGIIQPDGSLLTGEAVTQSIERLNDHGVLVRAREMLKGWELITGIGAVVPLAPVSRTYLKPTEFEIPDALVIAPGSPQWVSRRTIEAAIRKHAGRKATAEARAGGAKSDVSAKQKARAARAPRRQKSSPT